MPCASSEDFGAANQYIQHEVKPGANYTPVLPEGRCVDPQCGRAEPPHFPLVGRSQDEQPPMSPMGFAVMPRGGPGQGCLLVHTTGVLVPSDRGPAGKLLPEIGCESPEDVPSSDTSLDQPVQVWKQRGSMVAQLSRGKQLAAVQNHNIKNKQS